MDIYLKRTLKHRLGGQQKPSGKLWSTGAGAEKPPQAKKSPQRPYSLRAAEAREHVGAHERDKVLAALTPAPVDVPQGTALYQLRHAKLAEVELAVRIDHPPVRLLVGIEQPGRRRGGRR